MVDTSGTFKMFSLLLKDEDTMQMNKNQAKSITDLDLVYQVKSNTSLIKHLLCNSSQTPNLSAEFGHQSEAKISLTALDITNQKLKINLQ